MELVEKTPTGRKPGVEADKPTPHLEAGAVWRGHKRLMEVELETLPQAVVLRIRGSAGITEAKALRVALGSLLHQKPQAIVIDMSGLHYVASVAVSAVAAGLCRTASDRDRIRLAAPSTSVLDVLTRTRVTACVRVFPSVAAALAAGQSTGGPAGPGTRQAGRISKRRRKASLSARIPVTFDPQERSMAVPIGKAREGVPGRLATYALDDTPIGPPVCPVA